MTDWSKVMEVFGSGIIGVYLIMVILMVATMVGLRVVEYIENWGRKPNPEQPE